VNTSDLVQLLDALTDGLTVRGALGATVSTDALNDADLALLIRYVSGERVDDASPAPRPVAPLPEEPERPMPKSGRRVNDRIEFDGGDFEGVSLP
jgi:hypothetical protein